MSLNNENPKMVPAVRGAGFTGDWEQCTPNDFLTISSIPGTNGKVAKKLTVKLWGKGVVQKSEVYEGSTQTKYYVRHTGQLMYGKLDFLHQAFGIVPEDLDCFESTVDSPAFDVSNTVNSYFVLTSISRPSFYLKQGIMANGSRKAKRIHENTFLQMPILMPPLDEQSKVSVLLELLDSTSKLHQRKLSGLQQARRWAEQNLLPEPNENTPKVRVGEFDDEWTSATIGDISKEGKQRSADGELLSVTQHNGVVRFTETGRKDNSSDDKSNYKWVSEGDLVYNSMRMWQGASGLSKYDGIVSPAYTVVKLEPIVDGTFISLLFKNDPLVFVFRRHSKGLTSDTWNLKYPELSKIRISYPSLAEQQAIAKVFTTIDARINSEQQLIADLKEVKRWALDNMFV